MREELTAVDRHRGKPTGPARPRLPQQSPQASPPEEQQYSARVRGSAVIANSGGGGGRDVAALRSVGRRPCHACSVIPKAAAAAAAAAPLLPTPPQQAASDDAAAAMRGRAAHRVRQDIRRLQGKGDALRPGRRRTPPSRRRNTVSALFSRFIIKEQRPGGRAGGARLARVECPRH
eukprot:365465-Chlamydomonas_euryale.AAC.3